MEAGNYYFSSATASQSFPYLSYGAADDFADVNPDGGAQQQVGIFSNTFGYAGSFDGLDPPSGLAQLPQTSISPPSQALSVAGSTGGLAESMPAAEEDRLQRRRSSSEEKESLTPAQSRRKAQNRAAQRAFRERKERHVRDLEAKLNLLTTTTSSLQSDNERLKLLLQRAQTENEMLRASAISSSPPAPHVAGAADEVAMLLRHRRSAVVDPVNCPPTASSHLSSSAATSLPSLSSSPGRPGSSPGSVDGATPAHLLTASATWDLLQSHPLYLLGAVDIGEVCERLKKFARGDGGGPMFDEDDVRRVIEDVGHGASEELI